MEKETRNALQYATQRARALLTHDFEEQLEGDYDVLRTGVVAPEGGSHLTARQRTLRPRIVASIEHKRAGGMKPQDAVQDYVREAAFTTLNRFAALKMLEARGLVLECVSRGDQSSGYAEFTGAAPGLKVLADGEGYRLFIESIFDELSTEVKVLFDRQDPASALWPRRSTFETLLDVFNAPDLSLVWGEDETIGWVYQYFNSGEERRAMRDASAAPRNSRELAIRNQFFTPDYVVKFLADNTLGRIWYEMRKGDTRLRDLCEYMVRQPGETFADEGEEILPEALPEGLEQDELWIRPIRIPYRRKKDPRGIRAIDPACGSGHFLLRLFELFQVIYEEAWGDQECPCFEESAQTLHQEYPDLDTLRRAVPGLILRYNLHGVDIDGRCAQIAQLALWMRAQKAYRELGLNGLERPRIRRSNVVVAEPLVSDERTVRRFVEQLQDRELARVFRALVEELNLAGDLGLLLRLEKLIERETTNFLSGDLFVITEDRLTETLMKFVATDVELASASRRLFAEDVAHGLALLGLSKKRYDVFLMNPPFGAASVRSKKTFEREYAETKNDIYAAFVERSTEMLVPRGRVGAITSRTGFFLSTFQKWREQIILGKTDPIVFADLGLGVLDSAMVETSAYCLELRS